MGSIWENNQLLLLKAAVLRYCSCRYLFGKNVSVHCMYHKSRSSESENRGMKRRLWMVGLSDCNSHFQSWFLFSW